MDLIQQFIDTYKMKWTFYDAAGRLAAEKLQLALQNAGIRAIVTSRAKNPARLRTKVQRRNSRREEPYQTIEEIYDDIADLSGVRVSLYFPGDRGKVDAIISSFSTSWNLNSSRNSRNPRLTTNGFPAIGRTITARGCAMKF